MNNPFRDPPGIRLWFLELGEVAESAQIAAHKVREISPFVVNRLADAIDKIDGFLSGGGAFENARLRPMWQYNNPVIRTGFDRFARTLVLECHTAIALQEQVNAVVSMRDELQLTYGARFPRLLANELRRRGLENDQLIRARSVFRVQGYGAKVDRVRERMSAVARRARWPADLISPAVSLVGITADELALAIHDRLEARDSGALFAPLTSANVRLQQQHLTAEAALAPELRPAKDESQKLVELKLGRTGETNGAAALLWTWSLYASSLARLGRAAQIAWTPRPECVPASETALPLYVIPISEDYVLVSREYPSVIRVWASDIGLGRTIQAVLHEETQPVARANAVDDARVLFKGSVADVGLVLVTKPAIQLVARIGSEWIGQVTNMGSVKLATTSDGFVLIRSTLQPRSVRTVRADIPTTLLVGETTSVTDPAVWLKQPEEKSHETELLRRLTLWHPGSGTARIGKVRWKREEYDAYAPNGGFLHGESELVRDWVAKHPACVFQAVARLLLQVRNSAFALKLVHADCFTWHLDIYDFTKYPRPSVALLHAPFASRMGEFAHENNNPSLPLFPRLNYRGMPASSGVISPVTDAKAFSLFVLEQLVAPGTFAREATRFETVRKRCADLLWSAAQKEFAINAIAGLKDDDAAMELLETCAA